MPRRFVGFSDVPHVLRDVVAANFQAKGIEIRPNHRIDNFAAIALVASTRGVALLPAYVEPLLPWSVVSRPLRGETLTIDLAVGYRRDNRSPVHKTFFSRIDRLIPAGPAGLRSSA